MNSRPCQAGRGPQNQVKFSVLIDRGVAGKSENEKKTRVHIGSDSAFSFGSGSAFSAIIAR